MDDPFHAVIQKKLKWHIFSDTVYVC